MREENAVPEQKMAAVATGQHGSVTRDQLMARHKSNHLQVAYAPDAPAANLAMAVKAAMFREMGLDVNVCGAGHGWSSLTRRHGAAEEHAELLD